MATAIQQSPERGHMLRSHGAYWAIASVLLLAAVIFFIVRNNRESLNTGPSTQAPVTRDANSVAPVDSTKATLGTTDTTTMPDSNHTGSGAPPEYEKSKE